MEKWIRRHIRRFYWQSWHSPAGRLRAFRRLGLKPHYWASARSSKGDWRMARSPALQAALSNATLRRYAFLMPSELLGR